MAAYICWGVLWGLIGFTLILIALVATRLAMSFFLPAQHRARKWLARLTGPLFVRLQALADRMAFAKGKRLDMAAALVLAELLVILILLLVLKGAGPPAADLEARGWKPNYGRPACATSSAGCS